MVAHWHNDPNLLLHGQKNILNDIVYSAEYSCKFCIHFLWPNYFYNVLKSLLNFLDSQFPF